jgi:putative ABC transport system permease protein
MREIGVLRAIGMVRGQLSRMIVLESTMLAIIGATVGILVGTVNGYIILKVVNAQDTGWTVPLDFPWQNAAIYAAILVVVGVVAAVYPSRVAGRMRVVDALGYE